METFRLKSMTDFVLEQIKNFNAVVYDDLETASINLIERIENYANFLKQPLKLEMFVPCDEEGNFLEEPIFHEPNNENEIGNYQILIDEYQEAKQRVLFEYQWEFKNWDSSDMENSIIEDLLSDELIYTLTATAKKEIGL